MKKTIVGLALILVLASSFIVGILTSPVSAGGCSTFCDSCTCSMVYCCNGSCQVIGPCKWECTMGYDC